MRISATKISALLTAGLFLGWLFLGSVAQLSAAEHRVEVLEEAAPADELSPQIAAQLAPTGFRVVRGESRTVCDLWLCKQWPVATLAPKAADVIYPFREGQLIGAIRYRNRGTDFRDQTIAAGVYTLRYSLQPVDGAHVGTSPTRDFWLLVNAQQDQSPEALDYKTLVQRSAEAAQASHPALLSLQRVSETPPAAPSIRHDQEHDWWIVRLAGEAKLGDKAQALPVELVVVGVAAE